MMPRSLDDHDSRNQSIVRIYVSAFDFFPPEHVIEAVLNMRVFAHRAIALYRHCLPCKMREHTSADVYRIILTPTSNIC